MTIREHLNSIEQSGFYSNLFTGNAATKDTDAHVRMKTELSLAFPLLNDAGKAVLFLAWSAHLNHRLSAGSPKEVLGRELFETTETSASEAESAFTTLQEAVEDLVEQERFTDEQVEFIAVEMLGIEKPVAESIEG